MLPDTPLQAEIRAADKARWELQKAALKKCHSEYEREQCRKAYAQLSWAEVDVIGQRHGLPPMMVKAV